MAVSGVRERFNDFVATHEVGWELTMALLAVVYVATGLLADSPEVELLDLGLTSIFVAEFVSRFAAAHDRRAYLRGHWIDLVALVPLARGARLLRLLRLLRLVRAFAGAYRVLTHVERLVQHRGLVLLFTSWLAVMAISSMALYLAERGVPESNVDSFDDALWWGIVTLTTVGYGDVVPHTIEGKLAATVLMLLGIGLFAGITATITSIVLAGRAQTSDPVDQLRRLSELRENGSLTAAEFDKLKSALISRALRSSE